MNNQLTTLVIDAVELSVGEHRSHGYVQQVKSIINHPLAIAAMNEYAKDYNIEQAMKYAKQVTYEKPLDLPAFGYDGDDNRYKFTSSRDYELGDILSLDTRVIGIELEIICEDGEVMEVDETVNATLRNAVIEIVNDFLAVIPKNVIDFCLINKEYRSLLEQTSTYKFELMMIDKTAIVDPSAALTALLPIIKDWAINKYPKLTQEYINDELSLYYDEYMEVQFS